MKNLKGLLLLSFLFTGILFGSVSISKACQRGSPFKMSELFNADIIVRATAVKYIVTPNPKLESSGVPDSTIEFKVEETIWGVDVPPSITLHGYLSEKDDFNEILLPYKFVRNNGRRGSCFANTYKKGAQFLLFVRKESPIFISEYTTDISPLGPSNEQLHGADDGWVKWVKAYLSPCPGKDVNAADFGEMPKKKMDDVANKQASDLDKYRLAKCYVAKYGTNNNEAKRYIQVINSYETTFLKE